ncbi:MAG: hypothetical protein WCJ35_21920, partial [Planctomycetota bacterium]
MTADTTTNVPRSIFPRIFAVMGTSAYLRSAVAALFAVAAVFVASRRLVGALETPLGPLQLIVTAVLLAGLAQIAHALSQTGRHRAGSALISLAMLVLAASLSLPGSNPLALLGVWALIVGEELWAWRSMLPARSSAKADLPTGREQGAGSRERAASDLIEEPEPT